VLSFQYINHISASWLAVEKFKTWRLFKNDEMPGAKKNQGRSVLPVREGLNFLN
jgi:hypothetical protein